jgi:hypothetical protein
LLARDGLREQLRKPLDCPTRPIGFDDYLGPDVVTLRSQPANECIKEGLIGSGSPGLDESEPHWRKLCVDAQTCRNAPYDRAAKDRASLHPSLRLE